MNKTENHENQPIQNKEKKPKQKRFIFILIGVLFLIIGSGAGWYFGSQEGQLLRTQERDKVEFEVVKTQFELGVRELEEGRYENARKRFEYEIGRAHV